MDHSGMDMGGDGSSSCKISMLWNWYTIDACFLTTGWHIRNRGMFAASCIGVFLLGVILEALRRVGKEYDEWIYRTFRARAERLEQVLHSRHVASYGSFSAAPALESTNLSKSLAGETMIFRATPLQQVIRAFIHAVTFAVAYILMLLGMYYNGYMLISIFLGIGVGKFLTDWMAMKIVLGGVDGSSAPRADTKSAAVPPGSSDQPTDTDVVRTSGFAARRPAFVGKSGPGDDDRNPTVCCG